MIEYGLKDVANILDFLLVMQAVPIIIQLSIFFTLIALWVIRAKK